MSQLDAGLLALLAGSGLFLLIVLGVSLANVRAWRLLDANAPLPADPPFISILVPARDEAANIEACVRSLLRQDYPNYEVLVLDDESRDETAALVLRLAAGEPRLRLLRGRPLPPGWLGKQWACQQLAQAAQGEALLFTDADTRHAPGALRALVGALKQSRADLLAALPRQDTPTWGERLSVPALGWSLFSFMPLGAAHRLQWPRWAASPGQCLLVRRAAYERAGGHAAVRAHAADDLALGRRVMRTGGAWRLLDAGPLVACRMYRSLPEAARGFGKNFYAAFDYQALPFLAAWSWVALAYLLPPLALAWLLVGGALPGGAVPLALAGTSLGQAQWAVYARRFGHPLYLALIYPLLVALAAGLALWSFGLTLSGRAVWKGRALPRGPAAHAGRLPPMPTLAVGLAALRGLLGPDGPLGALRAVHAGLGSAFQLPIPGFRPIVVAGPTAARLVLVEGRDALSWRLPRDPVARLLRHGLLVQDGPAHDLPRAAIDPAMHRRQMARYLAAMLRGAEHMTAGWGEAGTADLSALARDATLLILMDTLFGVDLMPDLERLRQPIHRTLDYIAPGPWLVWPGVPRLGYGRARRALDGYLYALIAERRAAPGPDLVSDLIAAGFDDDGVRDQLLTMLIAGHDTSTALLAWSFHELAQNPRVQAAARCEVMRVAGDGPLTPESLGKLEYLDQVLSEALRLHPPIHVGNRRIVKDLCLDGYRLPAGRRLLFSIYLTHHDPAVWPDPQRFDPERFAPDAERARPPLSYVPFGAGPRFCLGAVFAKWEARAVLARVLRDYELRPAGGRVRPRMAATLEPRPAVRLRYRRVRPGPSAPHTYA